MTEPRLTVKELADGLRRSIRYVFYMKARGFRMVGGMATLSEALAWIAKNPRPTSKPK
jgi:hypothetical protein